MSLYWLEPGWTSALCSRCGANIWNSGGDPDWGECFDCFSERVYQFQTSEQCPEQELMCEICNQHQTVAMIAGLGVCSSECADVVETYRQ
jgi:hypothetical protein